MNEAHLYGRPYLLARRDWRREIAYKQDAQKIMERKPDMQSIFDIGGEYGQFGEHFGCTYWCYDPYTEFNLLPPHGMSFDVVVFRGVLQHIYNPIVMLQEAHARLERGGLLAILATPDTDSIGYLRWGTLPALDAPRNWIPFGHRMLRNILERLQYSAIEFCHPYGYPYASPLKDLWNFIIGKPTAFPGNMMECFARK